MPAFTEAAEPRGKAFFTGLVRKKVAFGETGAAGERTEEGQVIDDLDGVSDFGKARHLREDRLANVGEGRGVGEKEPTTGGLKAGAAKEVGEQEGRLAATDGTSEEKRAFVIDIGELFGREMEVAVILAREPGFDFFGRVEGRKFEKLVGVAKGFLVSDLRESIEVLIRERVAEDGLKGRILGEFGKRRERSKGEGRKSREVEGFFGLGGIGVSEGGEREGIEALKGLVIEAFGPLQGLVVMIDIPDDKELAWGEGGGLFVGKSRRLEGEDQTDIAIDAGFKDNAIHAFEFFDPQASAFEVDLKT